MQGLNSVLILLLEGRSISVIAIVIIHLPSIQSLHIAGGVATSQIVTSSTDTLAGALASDKRPFLLF